MVKFVDCRPNSARTAVPSTVTPPSFTVFTPPAAERTEDANQRSGLPLTSALGSACATFSRNASAVSVTALSYPAYCVPPGLTTLCRYGISSPHTSAADSGFGPLTQWNTAAIGAPSQVRICPAVSLTALRIRE